MPGITIRRDRRPSAGQRGIALIAVLWAVALLSLIAVAFLAETRSGGNLTRNLLENAKAEALADAGVYRTVVGLLESDILEPMTLGPEMADLIERRPELERILRPHGKSVLRQVIQSPWPVDGMPRSFPFGGERIWISIQDEGGKIDLNAASDGLLQGLFLSVGLDGQEAAAMVDAIADFQDENELRRHNGAEDADYRAAGRRYGAKDAPFEMVEELQQVLGMSRSLYAQVAPALTVYSGDYGIDPRTAPREALLALPGVNIDQVDALLTVRATSTGGLLPALVGIEDHLAPSERSVFSVRAEAHTASGGVFVRQAVVELAPASERPYVILYWAQGRRFARSDRGVADRATD